MTDAETTEQSSRRAFQLGSVLTLAAAHFIHDIYTAFLAPLLPLIIERHGLSLALAGTLGLFMQLPSLANVFLGAFVERARLTRWLVILAPTVTSLGMCSIGLAPSFTALIVLLSIVGVSVAAIHLAAPVLVADVAGDRLGRGTSFFMVGGELARTAGPIIAVQAVFLFGFEGLWRLVFVGMSASVLLWWRISRWDAVKEWEERQRPEGILATWRCLGIVLLGVIGVSLARAQIVSVIMAFLPTLLFNDGESLWLSNIALAVYEMAGVVGALTAGVLSDWLGRRSVLLAAVIASPLLLLLFLHVDGVARFAVLIALGFVALSVTPVLMAVVLERSGGNRATANGTFMMLMFTIRALVVPSVGALGDVVGLRAAFHVCALGALLLAPTALLIPKGQPTSQGD